MGLNYMMILQHEKHIVWGVGAHHSGQIHMNGASRLSPFIKVELM